MFHYIKRIILTAVLLAISAVVFFSCKKTPEPTVTISVKINSNSVAFTAEVTGADSFSWDFGDGSEGSTEQNPVHIYAEYGKEYIVSLKVSGPGGTIVMTTTVSIPQMTRMEMLTGGENDPDGRAWKLNPEEAFFFVSPDAVMTVNQVFAPGILTSWGFTTAYDDKYIFKYDGTFSISPAGSGVPAGLMYCRSKNISNTPPSMAASEKGLTQIDSYKAPSGLTFALNESKDLELQVCTNEQNVTNVTIPNMTTLTFSKEAFFGIKDWNNECVLLELTEKSLKTVVFISTVTPDSPNKGKISAAFILSFILAD